MRSSRDVSPTLNITLGNIEEWDSINQKRLGKQDQHTLLVALIADTELAYAHIHWFFKRHTMHI
jgi:hypothetical protein